MQNSFAGPGIDRVANLTYAATPSLVNEFVADYTTDHITLINTTTGIARQDFTGSGFFNNGYGGVLPSISVTGNGAYQGGFSVDTGYFPWINSNPTHLRIHERLTTTWAFSRMSPFREGRHFELRGEGFNTFNHTQWSGINTTACYGADACAADGFLTATSAHDARILQLAAKFVF